MSSPFANLGAEFANFVEYLMGDDDPTVTVERVDPQTGAATATAQNVTALKLTSTGAPVKIGGGGLIGSDECQFFLRASQVGFKPEQNDRIVEPDDGPTWNINLTETIGYGATGTLYRCPVTLAREDVAG